MALSLSVGHIPKWMNRKMIKEVQGVENSNRLIADEAATQVILCDCHSVVVQRGTVEKGVFDENGTGLGHIRRSKLL